MSRIFLALASLAVLLLAANLVLGLSTGDFGASSRAFQQAKRAYERVELSSDATREQIEAAREAVSVRGRAMAEQRNGFWVHIWLGIVAALISLLVNSISVTYFIGTSRWCAEVVDAYHLDIGLAEQSRRLKRRSFPWALTGILFTLGIAGLGAASDPYASTADPSTWVLFHWIAALVGTAVIALAFYRQSAAVRANYEVIEVILREVEAIRAARQAEREAAASIADSGE